MQKSTSYLFVLLTSLRIASLGLAQDDSDVVNKLQSRDFATLPSFDGPMRGFSPAFRSNRVEKPFEKETTLDAKIGYTSNADETRDGKGAYVAYQELNSGVKWSSPQVVAKAAATLEASSFGNSQDHNNEYTPIISASLESSSDQTWKWKFGGMGRLSTIDYHSVVRIGGISAEAGRVAINEPGRFVQLGASVSVQKWDFVSAQIDGADATKTVPALSLTVGAPASKEDTKFRKYKFTYGYASNAARQWGSDYQSHTVGIAPSEFVLASKEKTMELALTLKASLEVRRYDAPRAGDPAMRKLHANTWKGSAELAYKREQKLPLYLSADYKKQDTNFSEKSYDVFVIFVGTQFTF